MQRIHHHLKQFTKREDGPTAVEYAVVIAMIVIGCVVAVTVIGMRSRDTFSTVAGKADSNYIPIGGTAVGGTKVSSGIFTSTSYNTGDTELFNAATNEWTYTNQYGTFVDNNSNMGYLPGGEHVVWTKIQ